MTPELRQTLLSRLNAPEDQWTERKESFDERDVRRTIVAFANSVLEGELGVLFIGAANDGDHPGLPDADETQRKVSNHIARCYPKIEYTPYVLPVDAQGSKKNVLAIVVPYSKNRPHFSEPAFVRIGSETKEASGDQFKELVATQNDTARKLLQHKGKEIQIRFHSESGFSYTVVGTINVCDAHTIEVSPRDGARYMWPFPIADVRVHTDSWGLVLTVKPPWTEEQQIKNIVELRNYGAFEQLLANPGKTLPIVAAVADGSSDPILRHFLLQLRFALKKTQNPMTPEQKLAALNTAHRQAKAKEGKLGLIGNHQGLYEREVQIVAELATSVPEAQEFLKLITQDNPEPIRAKQRTQLKLTLGTS